MPTRATEILQELIELHDSKEHDYTGGRQPFENYRRAERLGIPAWLSVVARIEEKLGRIETFATNGGVLKDESVLDSLKDISLCAAIATALYEETINRPCVPMMYEVGVEGDLFHPHPQDEFCAGAGCVPV